MSELNLNRTPFGVVSKRQIVTKQPVGKLLLVFTFYFSHAMTCRMTLKAFVENVFVVCRIRILPRTFYDFFYAEPETTFERYITIV